MIKQFLDYKSKKMEEVLNNVVLTEQQKQKLYQGYLSLLQRVLPENELFSCVINLDFCNDLMQSIYNKEIPLVMDSSDLSIVLGQDMPNSMGDNYHFSSIDDFVVVHKSLVMPQNDMIQTQESSGLTRNIYFTDPSSGISHKTSFVVGNDTIHFTLNCVVSNHLAGNDWDNYPYAIMTSLKELDREKVADVKTEDTFVDGNVYLNGNYFVFCPYGEREEVQRVNPNAIVIEYKDISLNDAIGRLIIYCGKKLEKYGPFGWDKYFEYCSDSHDLLEAERVIDKNGYPILKGEFGRALHSETKYMSRRMWKREYRALLSLLLYNQQQQIDMPDNVVDTLLLYNGAYSLPGSVPVSIELYKACVIPVLGEFGYDVDDSFFSGVEENGQFRKIIDTSSDSVPQVYLPRWEQRLRERVIAMVKGEKLLNDGKTGNSSKK